MRRHLLIIGFLNLILLGQVYSQCDGTVFHVDQNATPGGDGLSWATAFDKLQDALAVACATDSIFVSEGTYYPDEGTGITNDARDETFQLVDGVVMLGGFSTNTGDITLASRDWQANKTILSGDIDQTPDSTDNSFHVVSSEAVGLATVMDGFTITAGNANNNINDISDDPVEDKGGGMYNRESTPTLRNLLFIQNYADFGAGIYNDTSKVVLIDVTLANNKANRSGGGIYDKISNSNLLRVLISGNIASTGGGMTIDFSKDPLPALIGISLLNQVQFLDNRAEIAGGGLYIIGENATNLYASISNSVFSGNSAFSMAGGGGGGISIIEASPIITGVTFTGNRANTGGAMDNFSGIPVISNSIIWNNTATFMNRGPSIINNGDGSVPTLANSLIDINNNPATAWADGEIATDLGNNLFVDPQFVSDVDNVGSSTGGNLRLLACSPAINAGTNTSLTAADTLDVEGNTRIFQGTNLTVDMGAFEFQGEFGDEMDLLEVSNTNNDGCGSLRQAIINAAPGDTVTFSLQIDGEPILLESQISINKSIVIEGRDSTNTIVDGQSMDRIFEVTGGSTVVLLGMRLQNGGETLDGGAIFNNGNLSIFQSKITANTVSRNGGGIYNTGILNIEQSDISDNNASPSFFGGGIYNTGNLCLEESMVSNNSANIGGGIYSASSSSTAIKGSNIFGNSAQSNGGGISANSEFSISLTTISCNEVSSGIGGGVYINSNEDLVTITNTAIYGNTASNGGGIFNNVGSVTEVKSSTIAGNEVSMQGGGILNNFFEGRPGELSIINTIVAINTAGTDGHDLFERTPSSSTTAGITDAGFNLIGDTVGTRELFSVSTLLGNSDNPLDPIFIENPAMPSDGICTANLRLDCSSPAISGGTPDTTGLGLGDFDLQEAARIQNILDVGAYEYLGNEMAAGVDAFATLCPEESIDLSTLVSVSGGTFAEEIEAGLNNTLFEAGSLPVGNYPVFYIVPTGDGCLDTANITVTVTNGMECLMDFTSFNIQALDPCNCENPNNIILNERLLVADTLIGMGPANQNIQIVGASSFGFRDPQGNPIADGTPLTEDPLVDGTYRLPFYRFADEVTQVGLSLNGGSTFLFQSDRFDDCFCNIEEPEAIPAISLWGLILLALFMMISSIVLLRVFE